MMELAERFVKAVENIAVSMEKLSNFPIMVALEQSAPGAVVASCTQAPEIQKYPADDNRDAWLELCKVRNIEVPAWTKTTTLIKWVKSWDIARPEGKIDPEPDTSESEADPFGAGSSIDGPETMEDPFSGSEEEPVTREKVLEALQKIQKEKGNPAVISLMEKAAGVSKLKDLPEDKYEAVYKEAVNG